MQPSLRIALGLLIATSSLPVAAAEIRPGQDLRSAIAGLQPGEELVMAGGTYLLDGNLRVTANGTADEPIVVRAKTGETPVIHQPDAAQNVIEIADSRYFEMHGIEFTGGSHGVRLMNSDFITIADCEIHDTGDVALSANSGGVYEGLKLLRNHIHHTNGSGEGMYLGCHDNACQVANSLVEGNYVHHTNGPGVTQGDGIEIKEGSYGNVIRDNVIHDTRYPAIIAYSVTGNGAPNVIEGNVMWNAEDNAIQVAADVVIRNNILLNGPIALQSHLNGRPSNIRILHNTVISNGDAIEVRDVDGAVVIANNAVYSRSGAAIRLISGRLSLVTVTGNVGSGGVTGASASMIQGQGIAADFVNAHFQGAPPIDLFPKAGSALIGKGDPTYAVSADFDGNARLGTVDAGAYRYSASGRAVWQIRPGFKATVRPQPPTNVSTR